MIAFTAESPSANPQFSPVDGINPSVPSQVLASPTQLTPPSRLIRTYDFPQQLIPLDGGKTLLRLRAPLRLAVDRITLEFDVENWGIRMRCDDVHELPRQIARRFLHLFSRADARVLSNQEQADWLKILDQVDYTQFSVERAAPHYVEGTLLKKRPLTVEWHDGVVEHLPASHSPVFFPLDEGDRFSAFAKLGKDNEVYSIERLALIPA